MSTTHSSILSLDITISHIAAFSMILFIAALIGPQLQQPSIAQEAATAPRMIEQHLIQKISSKIYPLVLMMFLIYPIIKLL